MRLHAGLPAALLLFLAAPAARAAEPAAGPAPAEPAQAERAPLAVLDEISGTVKAVDRQRQVVTVETAGGPVDLQLDRNTLVYQPGGATTVLSIVPGAAVRTGVDGQRRAFWIQLRPQAAAAPPAASESPAEPAPRT
jgi:outer membrane receptor protein involved in Fe transport